MVKTQTGLCRTVESFAEGDLVLKKVKYLKLDILRIIFLTLLVLGTGGFMLLLIYWLPRLRRAFLYRYVKTAENATHFEVTCWDDEIEFVKKIRKPIYNYETKQTELKPCFKIRYLLYVVDEANNTCSALDMPIYKPFNEVYKNFGKGFEEKHKEAIKGTFGKCKIDFKVPNYFTLFMQEIVSPFFIFQLYSTAIWLWEDYTVYAIVILCTAAFFTIVNLVVLRMSLQKIHKLAFHKSKVTLYNRTGETETKAENQSSTKLVPGTILMLKDGMRIPCDCILLQGQVLLNECSLTGESVPITKSAIPHNSDVYNVNLHKIFTVYEGTDVLQVNPHQGEARALVIRTGFSSMRGQLVRGILFPKPHPFKFASEVYYFMLILAVITVFGFIIALPFLLNAELEGADFAQKILDLVTIAIPPALPAALTVGVGYAIARLKRKKIDCISPPKTQVAGRVNAVCFDKTGTITYDEMDLKGIRLSVKGHFGTFLETRQDSSKISADETAVLDIVNPALATCHDIAAVGEIVAGDPMEIKLVEFTGLTYAFSENREILFHMKNERGPQLAGLKRFEFNSNLQRMSMISCPAGNTQQKRIYVKGAPEVLLNLCHPNTIPVDFKECLGRYTSNGYRVLALCYRDLTSHECAARLDDLNRIDCEKDLTFIGFAVFQNKPKPESKPTIELLHKAEIMMKMSTGDNPVTAAAVSKEVSIIAENAPVYICDLVEEDSKLYIDIQGLTNVNIIIKLAVPHLDFNLTKKEVTPELSNEISQHLKEVAKEFPNEKDDEVAITGRAFNYLLHATYLTEGKMSSYILHNALLKCKIFARMQPNHKIKLIEMIQKTKRLVAMVGDGANDCGALRTADCGLALSQAEASISAPFNSKILNISALVDVLKEGRCTLATNFHNFKFMALYSMCQFTATTTSYTQITSLANYQFLWQDLAVNMPLFLLLGLTSPYHTLTNELPGESLFSARCLTSVIGAIVIQALGVMTVFLDLTHKDFYVPNASLDVEGFNTSAQENAVVWLVATNAMVFACLAFSNGKPFRRPFYTNIPFTIMLFITFSCIWFLMISPEPREVVFEIPDTIPGYYYAIIFAISCGFGIAILVWEMVCVKPISNMLEKCCRRKKREVMLENDMDAPHQKPNNVTALVQKSPRV